MCVSQQLKTVFEMITFVCVDVRLACVSMNHLHAESPRRAREGARCPESGVLSVGCRMGAGN